MRGPRPTLTLAAVAVLFCPAVRCEERLPKTWVGGVELPNRYLFLTAHLPEEATATTGTLFFDGGEAKPIEVESMAAEAVRFLLRADGTTYAFSGSVETDRLVGEFFPVQDEQTRFPFVMLPMRRVPVETLRALEGMCVFEDGGSLEIDAVAPGFLRVYDRGAGLFHNFYPESDRRFFGGSGLRRPDPPAAFLDVRPDGFVHSLRGRCKRGDVELAEIAWTEQDGRAKVELPGGAALHLIRIEPGTFGMGDPLETQEAEKAFGFDEGTIRRVEHPPRRATLTRGFWLGRAEITNVQYAGFVDEEAYITRAERNEAGLLWIDGSFQRVAGASWRNPGREIRPDEPVVLLSWHDATAFCEWLSRRTGREVRLPYEAEWEYASRAGSDGFYGFGNDPDRLPEFAWFGSNAGGRPHAVESLKANAWGLYDMHGNVWEWCQDRYEEFDRSRSVIDPRGPGAGEDRVLRGGSWINGAFDCRSGYRAHDDPDLAEPHFGFRIAVGVELERTPLQEPPARSPKGP